METMYLTSMGFALRKIAKVSMVLKGKSPVNKQSGVQLIMLAWSPKLRNESMIEMISLLNIQYGINYGSSGR
jgi:hypothetical protein